MDHPDISRHREQDDENGADARRCLAASSAGLARAIEREVSEGIVLIPAR
jgi:hypothetical protein